MPTPFAAQHSPVPLPALYLYPLNDSFVPKHISLVNSQRVKIGRQTNAKTVPAERNGYFDSKVLSRQHAEVWEEGGKIYIKDIKSSNGTFINGDRLSPEGVESEPYELKTDDIVEFGIDIVGEDNKTIIHHKVAARVVCVYTEQEAQAAARAEAQQGPSGFAGGPGQTPAAGAFNFAGGQQQQSGTAGAGQQRRPSVQQGFVGMGGMGGNVRPPGKSGLTFDHILSRLQGELQKSRDTGAELHSLTTAMNEIHDTLAGNVPPNLPPYPSTLPPVMPPQTQQQTQQESEQQQQLAPTDSASVLSELQSQLHATQASLETHVEKIRALEQMLAEHEAIKREVSSMRELMEERKREMDLSRGHSPSGRRHQHTRDEEMHEEHYMSDDDDTRSINTVVPHELERVDEEDEEQLAAEEEEEERRRRTEELGRPRTPEPTGMGMSEEDDEHMHRSGSSEPRMRSRSPSPAPPSVDSAAPASLPDDLSERLTFLSKQLESALELSRSLEAQHNVAQSTISTLESKVTSLEGLLHETQTQVQVQANATQQLAETVHTQAVSVPAPSVDEERVRERETLTEMVNEWKKSVEGRWSGAQEEWSEERERLRRARDEWEQRIRAVEEGYSNTASKIDVAFAALQAQSQQPYLNGNAKLNHSGGLVTPPSPRSLSAESTRPRHRRKRASSRGRSRSRSTSVGPGPDDQPNSLASEYINGRRTSPSSSVRHRSPWATDEYSMSDTESQQENGKAVKIEGVDVDQKVKGMPFPITPESSVLNQPLTSSSHSSGTATHSHASAHPKDMPQFHNLSTAVGVIVLSVAAAAVIWRVKPEVSV